MASACGPEMPVGATVGPGFGGLAGHHHHGYGSEGDSSIKISETSQPTVRPIPNPPFTFPARPPPNTTPQSPARLKGRRPQSAIQLRDNYIGHHARSPSRGQPLPEFSFNPGVAFKADHSTLLSPPLSPQTLKPIPSPSRPGGHGHRRGGSEFVGGSIRMGDTIQIMNTSPTRPDDGISSPGLLPTAGRRMHMRNRSAIPTPSSPMILQPIDGNLSARNNVSAPVSPIDGDENRPSITLEADNHGSLAVTKEQQPRPVHRRGRSGDHEATKVKVGFSDTLEYIPRPLSMVSSNTSSTATLRPGHSLSGSISSVASHPNANSHDRENPSTPVCTSTIEKRESRPSTAGAVLDRIQDQGGDGSNGITPKRRNSIPNLHAHPVVTALPQEQGLAKTPKRWSFFGLDSLTAADSPVRSRPGSSSSSEAGVKESISASSSSDYLPESISGAGSSRKSIRRRAGKADKKRRKSKVWAGTILSRRAKSRGLEASLTVTGTAPGDVLVVTNAAEVATELQMPTLLLTEPAATEDDEVSRPVSAPAADDDMSHQIIDLDAALGPFHTPLPRNPEWEAAQRTAQAPKRQLYSAQGMKGFVGPGMHYHRRTESAPEMLPFEPPRLGLHRLGSSSTMADVFEEDEEEDHGKTKSDQTSTESLFDTPTLSPEDALTPATDAESEEPRTDPLNCPPPAESRLTPGPNSGRWSMRKELSLTSLKEVVKSEQKGGVFFRTTSIFIDKTESDRPQTPRRPRRAQSSRDLAPADLNPLYIPPVSYVPASPHSNSHASSFPSPRSPLSYDTQRTSTAPSSVSGDNNLQNLLLGEPGPELRPSVDADADVPSLTSSNSQTTRGSLYGQPGQMYQHPNSSSQRPLSVSSVAFGRRRSSLASLSRLINSAHGERSKLSIETPAEQEPEVRKPKTSRSKRLSKMMQFWKPKNPSTKN